MRNLLFVLILILSSCANKHDEPTVGGHKEIIPAPIVHPAGKPFIVKIDTCLPPQSIAATIPSNDSTHFAVGLKNFNTEHGLALSSVLCSYADHEGNLWFGTDGGGVSRYDGKSFTNFTMGHGLSNNLVYCIAEDQHHVIWFGTNGGGVSRYDGRSFKSFTKQNGLSSDVVYCITFDNKGQLLLGTGNGVNIYNGETFSAFSTSSLLASSKVKGILSAKDGSLWFGTEGRGLIHSNENSISVFTTREGLASDTVKCLTEDYQGNIWAGTLNGISTYNGHTFTSFTSKDGLADNNILCITKDKKGDLLFGSAGGVSIYDGHSFSTLASSYQLSSMKVRSILEDKNQNLWFSTYGGGVYLYSYTGCTSVPYFVNNILEDKEGMLWFATDNGAALYDGSFYSFPTSKGFPDHVIYDIEQDSSGNIWFGGDENGVSCYNGKTFRTYTTKQGLANNKVWVVCRDKTGCLWFGTEGGVSKYDGQSISTYTTRQGLANDRIRSITEDINGNMWFGTGSGGLSCFNGSSFINFTSAQGLANNTVYDITSDSKENLWVCTGGGGVSILRKDKLAILSDHKALASSFANNGPFFENFTTREGLASDAVYDLVENKKGDIIIGTNKGFTIIKGGYHLPGKQFDKDSIQYINQQTGYDINDMNTNAMFIDSKGIIWAGTSDKLIRLDQHSLNEGSLPPLVRIQNIKLNNENISWFDLECFKNNSSLLKADAGHTPAYITDESIVFGHTLSDDKRDAMRKKYADVCFDSVADFYHLPLNLVLPCKDNNITFDYAAIEPAWPFLIQYQFMLEEYDDTWNAITEKTAATYGNLFEGTYTFKVRARSREGTWSEPALFTFRVTPPWYRTLLAYVMYAILFILSLRGFIRWREKSLQEENEILEIKVKERTHELSIEKQHSENLLLNILPEKIAEELKTKGKSTPREYESVTVMFTDFKNFTTLSENLTASELVDELNYCYSAFDTIISNYGLEKIKTIGDSYMCAGGLLGTATVEDTIRAALEIRDFIKQEQKKRKAEGKTFFEIRIGCNTGPVVAGIVGTKKFAYDIWGDTVNIASRMESSGEPGKVNISGNTFEMIKDTFQCEYRGKIEAKNKGMIAMYFVSG